ncbi:MAG: hypothetical protein MEQ84_08485 [Mesorhizobium sp.]|nr:hypothetical protein [Mesorhizobium sp.]
MFSLRQKMLEKFGPEALRRPVSRDEFYQAVDQITETLIKHKKCIEEIDAQKGIKPRVRVPAETRSF